LLSLGTGDARAEDDTPAPPRSRLARVVKAVAYHIADANGAWHAFYSSGREKAGVLKRLSPEYKGPDFELDKFQKLDEIESQAKQWIATQAKELDDICDRLIAALFFFRLLDGTEGDVQNGEILCRLPADLRARENLVNRMLLKQTQDSRLKLFDVDYDGRVAHIIVVEDLNQLLPGEELRLHVKLTGLLASTAHSGTQIHVKIRSLLTNQLAWLPISGSPYKI